MKNDSLLLKLIYLLIDTTPRQKFMSVVGAFRAFGLSLRDSVQLLMSNYRCFAAKSVYVSVALHFIIFGALIGFDTVYNNVITGKLVSAGEVELSPEEARQLKEQDQELVEITGIYYISPEDLTSKNPKKVSNKPFNSLLAKLKSGNHKWTVNKSKTKNKDNSGFRKQIGLKPVDGANWKDVVSENKAKPSAAGIESQLNKHLVKYNNQFKSCYESVLLKDSSLNAKVNFLLKVGSNRRIVNTKINIKGVGRPESKTELSGCLSNITKTIRFPKSSQQIAGQQVKFQVVLNSWN